MSKLIKFSDDQMHHLDYLWREGMFSLDDLNKLLAEQAEKTRNEVCERLRLEEKTVRTDYDLDPYEVQGYNFAVRKLNEKIKEIKGE